MRVVYVALLQGLGLSEGFVEGALLQGFGVK